MLDKKKKEQIIKKFQVHKDDSGSSEVQIAILSEEVKELTKHLQTHKKDFSSRRGLLRKIGQRRRLLKFLEKDNPTSYGNLIQKLRLKKSKELIDQENKENVSQKLNEDGDLVDE
ncbi:30S ribosomal protein S15 [Patescibacteria group bacterium]|nr:30S ribosomal protein S15 [Patescibacteria group bacterium]MBU4481939.1 30S ribosomal protein S15 [Patescibacteria group bacterium]